MKSRWFSGSAYALKSNTLNFYSECERTAGLVKTHLYGLPIYVATDPMIIEDVLVRKHRCFVKSAGLRATQRGFGQGLLTSDRDLWRHDRPLFRSSRVEPVRRRGDGRPRIDRAGSRRPSWLSRELLQMDRFARRC